MAMKNFRKQLKAKGKQANARIQNIKFGTIWNLVKRDSTTLTSQLLPVSKGTSRHRFSTDQG
jgi:hypothetical protein